MKIKKRIAGMLACIMLLNAANVMANSQNKLPPNGLNPVTVSHTNAVEASSTDINPSAVVSFGKPINNPDSIIDPINPSDDKPEPEFYKMMLNDSLGNSVEGIEMQVDALKYEGDKYTVNVEKSLKLTNQFKNGRLYKLLVQPGHYHADQNGYDTIPAPISSQGEHPIRYFVTDFNTIAREVNDKVDIVWEYIPGAKYKLVYIDKDVDTKAGVDNIAGGTTNGGVSSITAELNENNIETITENGVKKVKYTLEDTRAGQVYSAYVVVTGISHSFLTESFGNVGLNSETPKIAKVKRSVSLDILNIGDKRIAINWQLGSWVGDNLMITKIWRKTEGEAAYTQIGTINNEGLTPRDPERFEHDEPSKNSYYKVQYVLKDGTVLQTKEVLYVPYAIREQPLKPQVPEPFSDSVKTEVGFNKQNYLVKDDNVTVDAMKPNTFYVKSKDPLQVQLVWDVPTKKTEAGEKVIDYETLYDIWVVEDESILEDSGPIIEDLTIGASDSGSLIKMQDGRTVVGFKELLTQYINLDGEKKALLSNKTYYIKIVAKKDYSGVVSESIPTVIAITIDKNGDIFAPPVLPKPPLRLKENGLTTTSIAIEWLEKWHEITAVNPEIYNADADEYFFAKLWNSIVYTGGSPAIKFKNVTANGVALISHILKTESDINAVKTAVGAATYAQDYRDREVVLGSDVKYEVKPMLYDDILREINLQNAEVITPAAITFEKWIVENESDTVEGWNTISPTTVRQTDGLDWKGNVVVGLKPNTRYVILIRAYRIGEDGKKLQQTFPSYVIATTLTDYTSPEADPTVPNLNPDGVTDSSVAVLWMYNQDFDYEIVYSRVEDPDKAKVWDFKISNVPGEENYVSNGAKASVKITGLLPETTYNVWIRAKQKIGTKISKWSSPVTQTTKTIGIPDVPRGLGPAAYQSILELGKDFKPVGSDYITVEWLKDVNDVDETMGDKTQEKTYSYVLEFADNPEFLDAIVVNTSGKDGEGTADTEKTYEVLSKNIVRFNKLIANRPYYVKVKTVLTFKDEESKREIVKESEYTKWVRILTKKSSDEYDGGDNENIITYPEAIVEDYTQDIWTVEIVDAAKIISDLMKKNDYFLTIKAVKYDNRYDAAIRRIKIPKEVIDTLINRGMELKVITNIGEYEIPAKTLSIYTSQYSAQDIVQFDFAKIEDYKIATIIKQYPDKLIKAEQLDIFIKGKKGITAIKKLDGYLKAKIKLDASKEYLYKNLFAYTYNFDQGAWTKENHSLDTLADTYITYLTPITGIYSVYEKVSTASTNASTFAMNDLASNYNISGLGTIYFKNDIVARDQFINMLLGIAQNKSQIDLTDAASSEVITKAKAAGIYIGSGTRVITEEQAIAGVIKLYELKKGYKIKPSVIKFDNVGKAYQESVSKAYQIGLIETINPKQGITYGTLCDLILQVTE